MCFDIARSFVDHLLSAIEDLDMKRHKERELGETISLEIEQLMRDHDRLRQRLSIVSARHRNSTFKLTSVTPPRPAHSGSSPRACAIPGPTGVSTPSPPLRDVSALPVSSSASTPPTVADAAFDVDMEAEIAVTAPTLVEEAHAGDVKIHADGA